jgi:cysteinyl-tRNA synthetase
MSEKYLGPHFDVHTGGVDHIPVHHTNEIAQSECANGEPLADYWLHNEFILIEGKKMSKSLGNIFTLSELEGKGIPSLAYRYWLLTSHYRTQANFTWESVSGARTAHERLLEHYLGLPEGGETNALYKEKFTAFINDDLDTPRAVALLWDMLKDDALSPADKRATLDDFDTVLGLGLDEAKKIEIPDDVKALLDERERARAAKDWESADRLREEIAQKGFEVKDAPEGYRVTKK